MPKELRVLQERQYGEGEHVITIKIWYPEGERKQTKATVETRFDLFKGETRYPDKGKKFGDKDTPKL